MVLDYGVGTSTFAGIAFWITDNNRALPRRGRQARIQRDPIPYGNTATVQIGGVDYEELRLNAFIEAATWSGLEAKVGTVGTLDLLGSPSAQAVLAAASGPQFYPGDYAIVQLTFVFA